ncbi:hypothetical protein AVEN_184165-1, partial [Araneus ventricosus]
SDAKKGYKSIKEKFRWIANVFLNSNFMPAQEAAYHLLSLPLSKCSRKAIYINTSPREERARMLKTNAELRCLNEDSTEPGSTGENIYVLLCAPSGKAAFLIEGVTKGLPELSTEVTNTIRNKLFNTKLLIIDEISMVGSTLFSRVDSRLRQIKGVNKPFGGISVLVVGDLNQLPPVMDSPIFKMGKCSEFCELIEENPLWELFVFYELKEIMRQKDEFDFIEALNALTSGNMKEKQIEVIKSKELSASAAPRSAIRLHSENKCVDVYNEDKIRNHPGPEYISIAKDVILGKLAESTKERVLEGLKR